MMFNALHREGSNLAMTSGRLAAETILEAMEKNDFSSAACKAMLNGCTILMFSRI